MLRRSKRGAQMSAESRGKRINLAHQGGGSNGALTCGVLDRLLEDDCLTISEISGTSAGAMNAIVLADGFERGGRDGGRKALQDFWKAVSEAARFSPILRSPWDRAAGNHSLDLSPGYLFMEGLSRLFSPCELFPLGMDGALPSGRRRHAGRLYSFHANSRVFRIAMSFFTLVLPVPTWIATGR